MDKKNYIILIFIRKILQTSQELQAQPDLWWAQNSFETDLFYIAHSNLKFYENHDVRPVYHEYPLLPEVDLMFDLYSSNLKFWHPRLHSLNIVCLSKIPPQFKRCYSRTFCWFCRNGSTCYTQYRSGIVQQKKRRISSFCGL